MATYVQRSCSRCGTTLESWGVAYRGLGKPFVTCPGCGAMVSRKHVNEWLFMGFVERTLFISGGIVSTLAYGAVPAVVLGYLIHVFFFGSDSPITDAGVIYWIILALIGISIVSWLFIQRIRESLARTSDEMYREAIRYYLKEVEEERVGADEVFQFMAVLVLVITALAIAYAFLTGDFQ